MKISSYIDLILEVQKVSKISVIEKDMIDGFDEAILILDDIQDSSKVRNGEPCYYLTHGKESAIHEAKRLTKASFDGLRTISKNRNLGLISHLKAVFLLHILERKIEKGQQIDLELQNTTNITTRHLNEYQKMIRLFTGGHIKYGFLIGFLLSKKSYSEKHTVALIGEQIGVLRQIDDDISDYYESHHEPLGDLIQNKKRLPELLFLLNANQEERELLEKYLINPIQNFSQIKNLIFSDKIIKQIEVIVAESTILIQRLLPKVSDEYKNELVKLTDKYVNSIFSHLNI